MSAAELREAAETLRGLADHAGNDTGKPWSAQVCDDGRAWINAPDEPHAISIHGWPAAARYIATMHPGVGTALAEWLDYEAQFHVFAEAKSLTIARLINGGAS